MDKEYDVITVAKEIDSKIKLLEQMRNYIKDRGEKKAETISEYDKQIALTIIKLKNGTIEEWEGEKIGKIPATLAEKIAKGICHKECLEKEKADAYYKSVVSNMTAVSAEMNALQSINKWLNEK